MLKTAVEPGLDILGQRSVEIGSDFDFACHGSDPSCVSRHGALRAFVLYDVPTRTMS